MLTFIIVCLVIVSGPWAYREWQLYRHRRLHALLFDPIRDRAKLGKWFQQVSAVFPGAALLPELHEISFPGLERTDAARAAIDLAAERFGYPRDRIELFIGASAELPQAAGAAELPPQSWSWTLEGDHMHFVVDQEPAVSRQRIFIAEKSLDNDEKLAWLAAHEVAHLALADARLERLGRDTEEVTDLATVVAGYGQLLLRHRYVEERLFGPGASLTWRVTQFGTLSKPAIVFARELRSRMRGEGPGIGPPAA